MSRRFRLGLLVTLAGLAGVAFVALLLHTFSRPGLRTRVDLSASQTAGLSERTLEALRRLPEGSRLTAFLFQEDPSFGWFGSSVYPQGFDRIRSLVEDARIHCGGRLETVVLDSGSAMVAREREVQRYQRKLGESLILESEGEIRRLHFEDLFQVVRANPQEGIPARIRQERVDPALGDLALAMATGTRWKAGIVTGYGQGSIEQADGLLGLAQLLHAENWEPVAVKGPAEAVDLDLLVVVNQDQPFLPTDLEAMRTWLEEGRSLFLALGPNAHPAATEQWNELLADHGTGFEEGLICEPLRIAGSLVEGRTDCAKLEIDRSRLSGQHPITRPLFEAERKTLLAGVRPVRFEPGTNDYTQERLVRSDKSAWIDHPEGQLFALDSREERGVFPLAVAAELWAPNPEQRHGRVLALGSAAALSAGLPYAQDLVSAGLQWLGGMDQTADGFLPLGERPYRPSRDHLARIHNLSVFAIPGVTFLIGFWVFWRRRR